MDAWRIVVDEILPSIRSNVLQTLIQYDKNKMNEKRKQIFVNQVSNWCDAEFENILNDIEYADVLQISDICDEPMNDTTLKGTTDDNSQSNLNDESTIKIEDNLMPIPTNDGMDPKRPQSIEQTPRSRGGSKQNVYACGYPQCGKIFKQPHGWRIHFRIKHDPEFEFNCRHCLKGYPVENDKSEHENMCKEKCFECHLCKYRRFNNADLMAHIRAKHSGERPFKCTHENCKYSYPRNWSLKRHIKLAHGSINKT